MDQFGNGSPWASFTVDPPLSLGALQALSPWFLVLQLKATTPASALEDPTAGDIGLGPRTVTASSLVPSAAPPSNYLRFVWRLRRGPSSQFDFISVGRNSNNDVSVPHDSISRFHAFFRETPWGLAVVDAKSANGSFVDGERVPAQGTGEPVAVASGGSVRFGDLHGVVLDAAGLAQLLVRG